MNEIDERYYDGFEGEPEMKFVLLKKDGEKKGLGIWDGYFDSIIEKIEPGEKGWSGLAYYYHLNIGWFEESPWLVVDMQESFKQLSNIDIECFEMDEEKEIIDMLIKLFREAIENAEDIYIYYD